MTTTIPDEFLEMFGHLWQLPAGMGINEIMESKEFIQLRKTIDTHCYATIGGNFLEPYLLFGLQKLGVPCFFPAGSSLAANDMAATTACCYEVLMQRQVHLIYLCPLDCAGDIPQITFGNASIKCFSKTELDALLNSTQMQRRSGYTPVDTSAMSQLVWLVVESDDELPADFSSRYWNWNINEDRPGTVCPYKHHYPKEVERAIFLLMLAAWEDWSLNEEYHWRPFDMSWIHTVSGDIFAWQQPTPSASTLTWIPRSHTDEYGDFYEYEAPHEYDVCPTNEQLEPFLNDPFRNSLEMAISSGLINEAARHQFVKAFLSDGVDEFLAHIIVIDACIGEKETSQHLDKKFKKLGPTGRLKYRLVGLLDDVSVKRDMDTLYEVRSDYVHGNPLEKISGEHIKLARILARRTLVAIIDKVTQSPRLTREVFFEDILFKGWTNIDSQQ